MVVILGKRRPYDSAIHRFILEAFAQTGRSPTLEDIQRQFALSSVEEANLLVAALERRGSVHRNPGDCAITHAYPFSNEPTAHRVQLAGGPQVYAMCAIDALGMPFMLKRDVEILSVCAQCGGEIYIHIQSGQIVQQNPKEMVVWLPARKEQCTAATDLCPDLNFFCSSVHLTQWHTKHPEQSGQVFSLAQALDRGRSIFASLLQEATVEAADA